MNSDTILLIIIIIYLLFLHNKKKYIENFSSINDIKIAVKEIYINDMNNLKKSLDFIKSFNNNNNLYISGNLTVNGIINSKNNIITKNDNDTVKASINNIYTNINNIYKKPYTKYWDKNPANIIVTSNDVMNNLIRIYSKNGYYYKDLDNYIDNNSLVYLTHNAGKKKFGLDNYNNNYIMNENNSAWKISQS